MKAVAQGRHAKKPNVGRGLLTTAAALTAAIVIALIGTGTSYALWNGQATVDASTVTSGTTGLTVDDSSSLTIPGLDLTVLAPGRSVVAGLTVRNTGTTKLAFTVADTATTPSNAFADVLTITITPVASTSACTAGLTGGVTARMTAFTTSASPAVMDAGSSLPICLEVKMDADAPASIQNSITAFTMNLSGNQVR